MKNRAVRLALVVLAMAGVAGAGYFVFTLERRATALREADRAFAEDAIRLQGTLAELRAAQAGYVATGQDTAAWIGRVQQLRQQADAQLERLTRAGGGQETELATLAESLASFGRFDERAQAMLRDEQPLAASALIFRDAAQVLLSASRSISSIRGLRATDTGSVLSGLERQALYAAGGAVVLVLLALLLLLPGGGKADARGEEPQATLSLLGDRRPIAEVASAPVPEAGEPHFDFELSLPPREAPRAIDLAAERREQVVDTVARLREAAPPRMHESTVLAPAPAFAPAPSPAHREESSPVDLAEAARLCTDLARVHDTKELQGLLSRAAGLLGASGIVVWMGSEKGDVLWPAFSHGYSPHALARMQALPREGNTPVSVAYRKGLMEVVPAADGASGAIVAPILTAGGCVGAMAVEVAASAETSESEQALACIIAAQLATLVAGEQG